MSRRSAPRADNAAPGLERQPRRSRGTRPAARFSGRAAGKETRGSGVSSQARSRHAVVVQGGPSAWRPRGPPDPSITTRPVIHPKYQRPTEPNAAHALESNDPSGSGDRRGSDAARPPHSQPVSHRRKITIQCIAVSPPRLRTVLATKFLFASRRPVSSRLAIALRPVPFAGHPRHSLPTCYNRVLVLCNGGHKTQTLFHYDA